jgi:hypothetical protein
MSLRGPLTGPLPIEADSSMTGSINCTFDKERINLNAKPRFPGLLQSPLTDSNRRPPPYHVREGGVTGGQSKYGRRSAFRGRATIGHRGSV